MKNLFLSILAILISTLVFSQVPETFSYQSIVKDADGNLLQEQDLGVKISILQSSATGTLVYSETHSVATNANGLLTLEIGDGTSTYNFSSINWASGSYYLKTEIDPTGGASYTISGTSQLLSVPYALHAKTAYSVPITGNEPAFKAWDKDTTELWLEKGDNIYFYGGDVGIGTSNPLASLDVRGSMKIGNTGLVFSELREMTGTTHATSTYTTASIPLGYNEDNIRIISVEINYAGDRWTGLGFDNMSGTYNSLSYLLNGSQVYLYYPDIAAYKDKAFRILFLKIE